MSETYMKEIMRVAVAQLCQTIGYNATQSAPLELLQDVLDKFMREFTRDLRRHVEHYNRTEPNLDDVALTMNSINVNLSELLDYVNNVEPVPFVSELPKFPARKESYLNFLKPGSKEVLTRPVHVHDHLPPMLPPDIVQQTTEGNLTNGPSDVKPLADGSSTTPSGAQMNTGAHLNGNDQAPGTSASAVLDKNTLQSLFKPSTNFDDSDRPTREVSSVVMTTGGYISPAVEGKMPDAIIPDIIDELMGLDAPPPPPPPAPPRVPTPVPVIVPVVKPVSRSSNNTPTPMADVKPPVVDEIDRTRPTSPISVSKPSKKSTGPATPKAMKTPKSQMSGNQADGVATKRPNKLNKKALNATLQLAPGGHMNQSTNYANMLLKKAKKQKGSLPLQPLQDKNLMGSSEKAGKLDPAEKTQRKYMKMLQKMAKQGKIPPDLLSTILGPDKKSKMFNPAVLSSMPPGPEKQQLEKLLKKQAKQRQKLMKQQMMQEQKQKKSQQTQQLQPPPLVPLIPMANANKESANIPIPLNLEEGKLPTEFQDSAKTSPLKSNFTPNAKTPPALSLLPEVKSIKPPMITESLPVESETLPATLQLVEGKELKLSTEPDRSKLNIFKKISKQKTPKSASPTPVRLPGLPDTPIINLPSGTTITPSPVPSATLARPFPPIVADNTAETIINLDDINDAPEPANLTPTGAAGLNRVFGEKPPGGDEDLSNKPKKRGRKLGSKNAPKVPGVMPNAMTKKNKKMKLDGAMLPPNQFLPMAPDLASAATAGNLTFDNVASMFGNPMTPLDWAQNKQLQQQMMLIAAAKDKKEQKKKNKQPKHMDNMQDFNALGFTPNFGGAGTAPSNEEVQSINKKLMRMDTILKQTNDLSVDTSLITGIKLPSPSLFPGSNASTSPLKSPLKSPGSAAHKRMMGVQAMPAVGMNPAFMQGNRPAFPNLPSNMLSMLPFAFPPRPGLIPTPGLFPTPGLGAFPNHGKNSLLPGLFPFPNLKQADNAISHDSEDLSSSKKKLDTPERGYCNVPPLVPEFLKLGDTLKPHADYHHYKENDLPKTPKQRNSSQHSNTPDKLPKKSPNVDARLPENSTSKSIPSTPGSMAFNSFEQLVKKNDSPLELVTAAKSSKTVAQPQEAGLDFSMSKKHLSASHATHPPITLNNEPIEVSDDSDEPSQPPPAPPQQSAKQMPPVAMPPLPAMTSNAGVFQMDNVFVNSMAGKHSQDSDLSPKELKKLKKQVKKTTSTVTPMLFTPDKTDVVSKLAGGADIIPLASTGMAYSAKNIPFNSLTANANPTFNAHKNEFHPPSTILLEDDAKASGHDYFSMVSDFQKKRKEHKKLKKLKELKDGKVKKKKDKKDKSKSKEKAEKHLISHLEDASKVRDQFEPSELQVTDGNILVQEKVKEKDLIKKIKKDKKKEKHRLTVDEVLTTPQLSTTLGANRDGSMFHDVEKKHKLSAPSTTSAEADRMASASAVTETPPSVVPKLTLKLGLTQSPTPMDDVIVKSRTSSQLAAVTSSISASPARDNQREPSPELARISPLVTRPPKNKAHAGDLASTSTTTASSTNALDSFNDANKSVSASSSASNVNMIVPPPSPWLSGGTISASSVLLPHQLLQTTKQHETVASTSSSHATDNTKAHNSSDRQSPLTLISESSRPSSYIDAEGHRVWICPACGKVDDGSPMIGCDCCDAWYHWICVGLLVAPKDNEDWFCRVCITRKKGLHGSEKKRKRNKKK